MLGWGEGGVACCPEVQPQYHAGESYSWEACDLFVVAFVDEVAESELGIAWFFPDAFSFRSELCVMSGKVALVLGGMGYAQNLGRV